jgi:hypothetical protein
MMRINRDILRKKASKNNGRRQDGAKKEKLKSPFSAEKTG